MNLAGATNTIGTLTTAAVGSTVTHSLGGAQTVFASPNYRNLSFSGAGVKTLQGDATIGGNMSIGAGSTFNLGTSATTVSRDRYYFYNRYSQLRNHFR
ncbi:MAG: hypothetical protein U0X76_11035 [Bacteroidia bacterium]